MPDRIAIRADGGGGIGLGHVMRCSALAHELNARDIAVDWITATPSAVPVPPGDTVTLHDIAASPDETSAIVDILNRTGAGVLVGDWKATDADRVADIRRRGWPVVLIGGWTGEAVGDLHVRQSFAERPPQGGRSEVSGADWLLLDAPCRQAPARIVQPRVRRVLVSLGGTDTPVLPRIRQALETDARFQGIDIEFRAPGGTTDAATLAPLHQAIAAADVGILAGGTTLHEAAALGLPALCLPIADNQYGRASQFQAAGLGIVIDPQARCFESRLTDALAALAGDPARRARMARRGQALVDGKGAARLAALIAERFVSTGR